MPNPTTDITILKSRAMTGGMAASFLTDRIGEIQEQIHVLSVAAYRDIDPPAELAGVSVIGLMAAQARLAGERANRMAPLLEAAA